MRIALRTSGGRGEYEVAGTQGSVGLSDVLEKEIVLQLFPGQNVSTGNVIRRIQGKTRIRLKDSRKNKHIYLILADMLLMPKPKRELGATPAGKLQLTEHNYSVVSIQFDIVANTLSRIVIQPRDLILENSSNDLARVDVLERTRILLDVWATASMRSDILSMNITKHRDSVMAGNLDGMFNAAKQVRAQFDIEDPLREILRLYSLLGQYTYWLGIHQHGVEDCLEDENPTPIVEAMHQRVYQWRLQASRGAAGQHFSREIKRVYNSTCLVTGFFLPKLPSFVSSGVDSAHILPWAEYGINSTTNGVCLSKLCHWAFDNGIIRIVFSKAKGKYNVSLSQSAIEFERERQIDLQFFRSFVGDVPPTRLPRDKNDWPSPDFLEAYDASMQSG